MMDELIGRLEDERPKVRAEAAAELVERCRSEAESRARFGMRFLTLLNDASPAVRGHAVVGAVICDEELAHVDRVMRLLADPSPGVRLQVIHTLGPLGLPGMPDALAELLADPDPQVRTAAASALAFASDERAIDVLLASLQQRTTREEALHALRQIAVRGDRRRIEQAVRPIFGAFFASRFEKVAAAGVLAALDVAEARRYLVERAGKKGFDRPLAMELCGELGIAEALPLLLRVAEDRADSLRGTALRALGSLRAAEALERCRRALDDEGEDADVRCDAAEGLLLLGSSEAEQALQRAREAAREERVRRVVAACLALWGRPPAEIRLYLPLSGDELCG